MRALVTGASGFVGLNVTLALAEQGHDVVAVGRVAPDEWVTTFLRGVRERVEFVAADVSRLGELARALGKRRLDTLVHAAVVTATTAEVERDAAREIVAVNIGGTIEALELARSTGARRFVYVSSPAAIGTVVTEGPVDESVTPQPETLYGITKLSSEMLTRRYADVHGLSAVSVRIAQPYGPGERATPSRLRTSPIYEWLEAARRGERLPTGSLDTARDWTWIGETARGVAELATAAALHHDLYHLSVGQLFSVADVLVALRREHSALRIDERAAPPDLNPNIAAPTRRVLSSTRFRDEFGWAPETSVQEGMRRYLDWRGSWTTGN
jgi:nucleoside-diphosphate-sugar epimerase